LDLIDWNLLKDNKKLIIGASDFTAILNGVYAKLKEISYHWINASWYGLDTYKRSIESFREYFLHGKFNAPLILSRPEIIKEGRGKGIVVGGNFETFERLIGTDYFPPYNQDYILFLEDIGKSFSELRAAFQHLFLIGFFERCRGLILGHFTPLSVSSKTEINLDRLVQLLAKHIFCRYNFPIIYSPNIGHEVPNEVLPIGAEACIDTSKPRYFYIL
jgi:muramoyltetrapeptide carboxypeptidase